MRRAAPVSIKEQQQSSQSQQAQSGNEVSLVCVSSRKAQAYHQRRWLLTYSQLLRRDLELAVKRVECVRGFPFPGYLSPGT